MINKARLKTMMMMRVHMAKYKKKDELAKMSRQNRCVIIQNKQEEESKMGQIHPRINQV